ncbi:hypothetical protein [Paenibacillus taichungensis]|uniref:hypothetical protein n=1 Tax=Paenibacillus taichungensis TaxID=484184 RepID=UPI0039A168A6
MSDLIIDNRATSFYPNLFALPDDQQIKYVQYLNQNPSIISDFVQKQRAGQNPPPPPCPISICGPTPISMRTLTGPQQNILLGYLNNPKFAIVFIGNTVTGILRAELIRIMYIYPSFDYEGFWHDPSDGTLKAVGFFNSYTWGVI